MKVRSLAATFLCVATWFLAFGCEEEETVPDDGKVRPEGNGVARDEGDACDELSSTLADAAADLSCVATFRLCPELLSSLSGESCSTYDEGSVGGCVDYYEAAADCEDLAFRAGNCIPAALDCP